MRKGQRMEREGKEMAGRERWAAMFNMSDVSVRAIRYLNSFASLVLLDESSMTPSFTLVENCSQNLL